MRVQLAVIVWLCTAVACAPKPPLQAIVEIGAGDGSSGNTVLALPVNCIGEDEYVCDMASLYTDRSKAPKLTMDEIIAPVVRLKLELAGYTVVDPKTLRLETAERIDVTDDGTTRTSVEETPTVASLSLPEAIAAARSINLGNMLMTTVRATRAEYRIVYELIVELRSVPAGELKWTARCREIVDVPDEAVNLLASCVGDGVLAWRAPEAVIGQLR
jgi:hypothetical protein